MGRIRRSWATGTLLGLALSWMINSVQPDPVQVVPNFYDPKYHDDGRDQTKVVEYTPLESSSVYNYQPSPILQEYHDINPGSTNIFSGTGPLSETQRVPIQSDSFVKAHSDFQDGYEGQSPNYENLHLVAPAPTGSVGNGQISHNPKPSVSVTPSQSVSNSYNSVPVYNADPVYNNPSFSRYPLSGFPPSVPVSESELQDDTSRPYPSSVFSLFKEHKYEPTVLKESNEGPYTSDHGNQMHKFSYKIPIPLAAFFSSSRPQKPKSPERPSYTSGPVVTPISDYTDEFISGPYQPSGPQPSHPTSSYISEFAGVSEESYKPPNPSSTFYQSPSQKPTKSEPSYVSDPVSQINYKDQIPNGPYSSHQTKIPSAEFSGHNEDKYTFRMPSFAWPSFSIFSNSRPETSSQYRIPIPSFPSHLFRGWSGQSSSSNADKPNESYNRDRPMFSSNYDTKFPEVSEYGSERTPLKDMTTYKASPWYKGQPSTNSKPLASFYDSMKLPDFGDGVTVTHTSYPPTELSDFDVDNFALFNDKPSSMRPGSEMDGFMDDGPASSPAFKIKPNSHYGSFPFGEPEEDIRSGWTPFSSLFTSNRWPSYEGSTKTSPFVYRPKGSSNYGSYKPPETAEAYFARGKDTEYGTPYDLIRSPNYRDYYKNQYGGWENSHSSPTLDGYRYKYSTLHYPGTNILNLPTQYETENNPHADPTFDCENRHSCNGQQTNLGIASSVDLTRRPPKRFRNSFFKTLIRNLAGKKKHKRRPPPRGRPCRGRRC